MYSQDRIEEGTLSSNLERGIKSIISKKVPLLNFDKSNSRYNENTLSRAHPVVDSLINSKKIYNASFINK